MSFTGVGRDADLAEVWKVVGSDVEKVTDIGTFAIDSYYIVLNKKGTGSIHMWVGNVNADLTTAIASTWIEKSHELNTAVGGSCAYYSEVEGFETSLFQSCFKSGITYLATGSADSRGHRLLQIKGKGGKRIKEVSMSSYYFASLREVFILDAENILYIQAGPRASLYDRIAASGFADEINNKQREGKATIKYMYEDPMNEEFWAHFKSVRHLNYHRKPYQ
jgi:hypothetical protein